VHERTRSWANRISRLIFTQEICGFESRRPYLDGGVTQLVRGRAVNPFDSESDSHTSPIFRDGVKWITCLALNQALRVRISLPGFADVAQPGRAFGR
jgi:hypothetical protein